VARRSGLRNRSRALVIVSEHWAGVRVLCAPKFGLLMRGTLPTCPRPCAPVHLLRAHPGYLSVRVRVRARRTACACARERVCMRACASVCVHACVCTCACNHPRACVRLRVSFSRFCVRAPGICLFSFRAAACSVSFRLHLCIELLHLCCILLLLLASSGILLGSASMIARAVRFLPSVFPRDGFSI